MKDDNELKNVKTHNAFENPIFSNYHLVLVKILKFIYVTVYMIDRFVYVLLRCYNVVYLGNDSHKWK